MPASPPPTPPPTSPTAEPEPEPADDTPAASGPEPGRPAPLPLSVVTVCRDNEATIGATLASVAGLAAEIVAVDSGSKDRTVEICRGHGAVVVQRRWRGHVKTKQVALGLARQRWVLHLDSDEPVLPDLARSIRELIERDMRGLAADIAAARVNRVTFYRGRPLRHAWQPEPRLRLVRRALVHPPGGAEPSAFWAGRDPHDRLDVLPRAGRVIDLAGTLRHDSFATFAEHFAKQAGHARVSAESLFAEGRRSHAGRMIGGAAGAFFKQLVLKRGWRDGTPGLLAAASTAVGSFMKHAALIELGHAASEGGPGAWPGAASASSPGAIYDGWSASARPSSPGFDPPADPDQLGPTHPPSDRSPIHVSDDAPSDPTPDARPETDAAEGVEKPKKKRRRRRRKPAGERAAAPATEQADGQADGQVDAGVAAQTGPDDADLDESREDDDADEAPSRHLRTVKPVSEEARQHVFDTEQTFRQLGLNEELCRALDEAGWENPTKIQGGLIPLAIGGKDVLGQAKTGSGKTAAFGLPVLHRAAKGEPFQALILAPTRELALQIRDDLTDLGKHTGMKAVAIYGGQKISTQADKLARGPEIIVGTPGRVMDMHGRRLLPLDRVKFAVLDEVDRMFDIGFRDDIKRLLGLCPRDRQTVFVSATISDEIERLAKKHMRDPERLTITSGSLTVEMVKQHHIPVQPWDKRRMLAHVLTHEEPDLTIVFCRMKRTVDDVCRYLERKNIKALALHGDLSQGKRNETMKKFRSGELAVLVASDLAARGLDVDNISHVVNYDLPDDPDLYVHRIGRTARAGREGIAWSLVTPEQGGLLTEIENLVNAEIPKKHYPDFDERDGPPEGWKPEPKPGFQPVVVEDVKEARNRLDDAPELPIEKTLDDRELAAKFPGGVVPKALPKRRLRGKLRTTRGNKG